jgi:Ni/Co efflux regulator RcnB
MKRFAIAAAAALTLVGPLAATSADAAPMNNGRFQQDQRGNDRNDRNDRNGRNDRNDRNGRGNDNRGQRWNQNQHNGYYANGRFNYGQPTVNVQSRADFRPGWQTWRRGDRLPSAYRSHYRHVDYRSAHLRAPPRGYEYVRGDRGDLLLVAITTGVILSILANQ